MTVAEKLEEMKRLIQRADYGIARAKKDSLRLIKALEFFVGEVRASGDEGDSNVWDKECEKVTRILKGGE